MNKKGFTLIELLAVIVILAIIALIATPIVLNLIRESKKNTEKPTKPTKPIPTETQTQTEIENPTDGSFAEPDTYYSYVESYSSGKIVAKVYKNDTSYEIYCRIYDNNGNMLGNDNLYSNSKRAGIVMGAESVEGTEANYNVVEYDTTKLGTNLSAGCYYVVFYDDSGKDICNGYIYVRGK